MNTSIDERNDRPTSITFSVNASPTPDPRSCGLTHPPFGRVRSFSTSSPLNPNTMPLAEYAAHQRVVGVALTDTPSFAAARANGATTLKSTSRISTDGSILHLRLFVKSLTQLVDVVFAPDAARRCTNAVDGAVV